MRDHRWTRKHLSEYLDEELGATGRERVERHVRLCPHCHKLLATLRRTLDGLHELGEQPLQSTGVADSVIRRPHDPP